MARTKTEKANIKRFNRQVKLEKVKRYNENKSIQRYNSNVIHNVFSVVIIILLVAVVFRVLNNDEIPTFNSLLELIQNGQWNGGNPFPDIPTVSLTLPDWLDWINSALNGIIGIFNVLWFFIRGIIYALNYVVIFSSWLFTGVV